MEEEINDLYRLYLVSYLTTAQGYPQNVKWDLELSSDHLYAIASGIADAKRNDIPDADDAWKEELPGKENENQKWISK